MKQNWFILAGLILGASTLAVAQTGPVGQSSNGIIPPVFTANTDSVGFHESSLNAAVTAAGTTQATATLIQNRTTVITSCPTNAGVQLPSVDRYMPITVLNRSGATCLVYPSPGATVETALGTDGATNAANTQGSNTDVTYRPISPTRWLQ